MITKTLPKHYLELKSDEELVDAARMLTAQLSELLIELQKRGVTCGLRRHLFGGVVCSYKRVVETPL